jgi:hypothetical protein
LIEFQLQVVEGELRYAEGVANGKF